MEQTDTSQVLECALLASHILLENGAETYRAEESVLRICHRFGIEDPQVLALPTGTMVTIMREGHHPITSMSRVRKRTTDLTRIDMVNQVSRSIVQGDLSLSEAIAALQNIVHIKPNPRARLYSMIAAGISSGCFALLFGGGWFDFLVAALSGFVVQTLSSLFKREDYFHFIISLLGGACCALIAVSLTTLCKIGSANYIIAGAIMPLLPGLAMTNAIRDTMRGDLISGVARAAEALLIAVSLATGVGVILGISILLGGFLA